MSDPERKDLTTKAKEEITPDSSKSTQQKIKETVTDTKDRIVRGLKPDEQKGPGQEAYDKAQRVGDIHTTQAEGGTTSSVGDKVKDSLGMGK